MIRNAERPASRNPALLFGASVAVYALLLTANLLWRKIGPDSFGSFFSNEKSGAEALTFALFFFAGAASFAAGLATRRAGAFVYALFCFFIAFEDVQWGYTYLGFEMPDFFRNNIGATGKMSLHSLKAPLNIYLCYLPLLAGFLAFLSARAWSFFKTKDTFEALPFLLPILMIPAGLADDASGNIAQAAVGYWALVWPLILLSARRTDYSKETG